jgi:Tfp pilus assembly protein PilX
MKSAGRTAKPAGKCLGRHGSQSGVALILALIVLFILSAMAAGMMSVTQTEIWSTSNFRTTTQARYIAEAGIQQAVNYLSNRASLLQVSTPNAVASIPTDGTCTATTMPLTCVIGGTSKNVFVQSSTTDPVANIVTSGSNASTYFSAANIADFQAKVGDGATTPVSSTSFSSLNGGAGGHYSVAAQLLSVRADPASGLAQMWKLISVGAVPTVNGVAKVQVVETFEIWTTTSTSGGGSTTLNVNGGVQAGSSACGAITVSGGSGLESYNSTSIPARSIPNSGQLSTSGNTVITEGSLNFSGSGTIYGNLETNRAGDTYGTSCPSSASAVNVTGNPNAQSVGGVAGLTASGSGWGTPPGGGVYSIINLPATNSIFTMTTPTIPTTGLNTGACTDPQSGWTGTSRCNGGSDTGGTTNQITFAPNPGANYGNVTIAADITLNLTQSGLYTFNSLNLTAGGSINVAPGVSVAINITGLNSNGTAMANPISFSGYGQMVQVDNPSDVIFQYAGSGAINFTGSGSLVGVINAPNASFSYSGSGTTYGAILTNTASFSGSGTLEYDQNLGKAPIKVPSSSTPTITYYAKLSQFSWSAF